MYMYMECIRVHGVLSSQAYTDAVNLEEAEPLPPHTSRMTQEPHITANLGEVVGRVSSDITLCTYYLPH